MQILLLMSFCFSMYISVEGTFMDGVRSHFQDEDVLRIEKCMDTLALFVNGVNEKQKSLVLSSIAFDQKDLKKAIINMMQTRNIKYSLYLHSVEHGGVEILSDRVIKLTGDYELNEACGFGTSSIKGFSNYYLFENRDGDSWVIVDTNFHTKLDWDYYYFLILFLLFLFYIWMLIDCFNRKFEKRGKWFCIIIFIPFIGNLLYFFRVKLKQWDNQPDYYEKYLSNDVYPKDVALAIRNNWIYVWTLGLLAMIAFVGIPDALCNGMMIEVIAAIKNLLFILPIMYIFLFVFAYQNLGTGVISLSLWGLLFMILSRVWQYATNLSYNFSSFQLLLYKNTTVFLLIVLWLVLLFIVSYRLLRLNEAVQDKRNI